VNADSLVKIADAFQLIEAAVGVVPLESLPRFLGDLECLRATAELRLKKAAASQPTCPSDRDGTHYLSVKEVAEQFHVKTQWVWRHKKHMPHSQPSRKILLFPREGITKWFASRKRP
jgi:hypothetical protein